MKRITISVSAKPPPASNLKPVIAIKKKVDASITGLKIAINQHIGKMKLQTEQKLYVVVDEWLSGLTCFETESVHKIVEIHEHAIKNM